MSRNILIVLSLLSTTLNSESIKTPQHVFGGGINHRNFNHPGDYPFPTDMTFKNFADHCIDPTTEYFDPDCVNQGDTIFLSDWYIPWFTRYVHPKIKHPYILISNDSDEWHPHYGIWDYDEKNGWFPPVDAIRTLLYDSKVAAWFCKNMVLSRHPKIVQIPIGPNIIYWGNFSDSQQYFMSLAGGDLEKKHLLYMSMQLASNPIRPHVAELFQDKPYCFSRINNLVHNATLSRKEFFDELAKAMYTPTPPGYGPDIVRLWEAIPLNCIPIVTHSDLDDLYSDLPVLFVQEWEDVNEELLRSKHDEILKVGKEKAYFDYWANLITEYQKKVRDNNNVFSSIEATQFKPDDFENLTHILKKHISKNESLLCKGAVMGLRPFQIAKDCKYLARIYVQDPWGSWGHEKPTAFIENFTNHPLVKENRKITPISYYEDASVFLKKTQKNKSHLYLDLSYRRHTLKKDLEELYPKLQTKSLLCGNMASDPYVSQVLQKFSASRNLTIQHRGNIWYFTK